MKPLSKPGKLGAAAAVTVAALSIAGCGSSHPAPAANANGAIDGAAISRAADVSGAAKGEKVAYTMTESLPSLGQIKLSGTGAFNNSPAQGQMNLKVSVPGASSLGASASSLLSNLAFQLVIANKAIYVQIPSSLSSMVSTYTGGKPWVEVNLAQLASSNSKLSGLSSLLNGQTSPTNPADLLKQFSEASTNGVTKVGSATVNGVSTTEYRATLNYAKLASTLPAAKRAAVQKLLQHAAAQMGTSSVPVEVYVDSSNLVRRIVMNYSLKAASQSVSAQLQMDFLAYGAQPAPTVPAASQVDDLTSAVSNSLGSLGSGAGANSFGG